MLAFIGFVVVFFILLHKRSTGIITVNPLKTRRQEPLPGLETAEEDEPAPRPAPNFAGLLGTIQQAAQKSATNQGRAMIIQMVKNDKFLEAIQLYRRFYGVDLETAKKAVNKIMLER